MEGTAMTAEAHRMGSSWAGGLYSQGQITAELHIHQNVPRAINLSLLGVSMMVVVYEREEGTGRHANSFLFFSLFQSQDNITVFLLRTRNTF